MIGKITYTVTLEVKDAQLYTIPDDCEDEDDDELECEICEDDICKGDYWIAFIGQADEVICTECWDKHYKKAGK